jgi:hypothetical protein
MALDSRAFKHVLGLIDETVKDRTPERGDISHSGDSRRRNVIFGQQTHQAIGSRKSNEML